MADDSHSHELLAIIAAVHHERIGEALNDGAIRFPKSLDGIAACRMGDVDRRPDLNVVAVVESLVLALF